MAGRWVKYPLAGHLRNQCQAITEATPINYKHLRQNYKWLQGVKYYKIHKSYNADGICVYDFTTTISCSKWFQCIGYDYVACMDYMDPDICCPQKILTHWGRVTHICVSKIIIIGSDNGLSPGRRQAIIWTNAGILLIEPLGTNFSEILIEIHTFSFKKMLLKMSSAKWRLFGRGLNELIAHSLTCSKWNKFVTDTFLLLVCNAVPWEFQLCYL